VNYQNYWNSTRAMESLQGSWQYENFSSATREDVSPLSPSSAPPSPTLYSHAHYTSSVVVPNHKLGGDVLEYNYNTNTFLLGGINSPSSDSPFIKDNGGTSLLSSVNSLAGIGTITPARSVTQSNNNHLMGHNINNINFSITNEMDDADLAWNDEESFNLEAFEDLGDFDVAEVNNLLADEVHPPITNNINNNSNNLLFATPVEPKINESSVPLTDHQEKIEPEKKSEELMYQFQTILKNLEASNDPTSNIDGDILDISGIFHTDELIELANDEGIDLGLLSPPEDDMMMEEDEDSDSDSSSSGSYRSSTLNSQEVYLVADTDSEMNVYLEDSIIVPSQSKSFIVPFSGPSSVASSSVVDDEDDRQDMTLDALLDGDVDSAVAMYPNSSIAVKRGRRFSKTLNEIPALPSSSTRSQGRSATVKAALTVQKPERRGRKPSSVINGKPWVHVKDKALRKKEQNKTAATRYRQKKKVEAEVSMHQEQELAVVFDKLLKQKEDLAKEISMVKSLLRAIFSAKKVQKKRR
jgi:hypothetical protein